jgi:ring-1,2-phenylacetyl-CoA epoxidase subunit PaaC
MQSEIKEALSEYLLALGDDELILGHRDSEWCGHAPLIEEDIAFANLALDEIGHAAIWYTLLADLLGEDREGYPDRLIFQRPVEGFRNAQLFELPRGDWAFSLVRQYLFDLFEMHNLSGLEKSTFTPLAEAAQKIRKEEIYHHRHTRAWVQRLALGTSESWRRMKEAVDQAWPLTVQLFLHSPADRDLVYFGYIPSGEHLYTAWLEEATKFLQDCQLSVPAIAEESISRRVHTAHLKVLVDEMQSVARLEPEAAW